MLSLLCNLECYAPEYLGKRDVLLEAGKIGRIAPPGNITDFSLIDTVYECEGFYGFPGLIDQHVHILGGGGEQGFSSRVKEIETKEIWEAGVTSLVGLLGADAATRSLESLYAKAKALESDGLTTFLYTGSYSLPPVTFTGSVTRDLVFIDKVIGVGEIAVSDHRSSVPAEGELLKLAAEAHLGGLLSGKAGVVHLHIGDGKEGISVIPKLLAQSDLPAEQFVPTHLNRNPELFRQALSFRRSGGLIDLTAGETAGIPVAKALRTLFDEKIDLSGVTVSSDANGSIPGGGVSRIGALYEDLRSAVLQEGLSAESVFRLVTENVAKILKLYPRKGTLQPGSDADLLIADKNFNVQMLFAGGKLVLLRQM